MRARRLTLDNLRCFERLGLEHTITPLIGADGSGGGAALPRASRCG